MPSDAPSPLARAGAVPSPGRRPLAESLFDSALVAGLIVVVTFATGIALARLLGPGGRGQYGVVQFWAQFAVSFGALSLFEATVVRLRSLGARPETALPFTLMLALGLIVLASAATGAAALAGLLGAAGPFAAVLPVLVAIGFLHHAFIAVETAGLSFRRVNRDRLLTRVLFMLGAALLWAFDVASVAAVLAVFVLTKLPVLLLCAVRFRRNLAGPVDRALARQVLALGPRLHVAAGLLMLAGQIDRMVIAAIWPEAWLGYYFVAYSAAGAGLSLASQAIHLTLLPALAGLGAEARREKVERLVRLALAAAACVAVPVWAAAPWLVPLAYGEGFAPAVPFVQGLMLAMVLTPVQSVLTIAHKAGERARPGAEMALASLAVFAAGFALTRFETPGMLFATLALANLAGVAAGLMRLAQAGEARLGRALLPGPEDLRFLAGAALAYARRGALRLRGRA